MGRKKIVSPVNCQVTSKQSAVTLEPPDVTSHGSYFWGMMMYIRQSISPSVNSSDFNDMTFPLMLVVRMDPVE